VRTVEEWVGKTDDTPIPTRVRVRVFDRFLGICQCGCQRRIHVGDNWDVDHVVAIINGGQNRESNLHPKLKVCHKEKTAMDVATKSKTYRVKSRHLGLKKTSSRPIPGSKSSGWKKTFNRGWVKR
jgi:5-methylcytosine-specific restriction enzyme A